MEADKQKLKQVLFNLLSNAVKFSKPNGGSIRIITKKYDDQWSRYQYQTQVLA